MMKKIKNINVSGFLVLDMSRALGDNIISKHSINMAYPNMTATSANPNGAILSFTAQHTALYIAQVI